MYLVCRFLRNICTIFGILHVKKRGEELSVFTVKGEKALHSLSSLPVGAYHEKYKEKYSIHTRIVCLSRETCASHTMVQEVHMKDFASFDSQLKREAEQAVGTLNGKSEGELIREIYEKAEAGKRAGTLTNEQIDAFYARFSSMLDPVRRRKLKGLVERLKSI